MDLGTAGIVVINKDQDIIKCMARIARFYKHESCGQCTPCREGTGWMWRMLERMAKGEASRDEVDMLGDVTNQIADTLFVLLVRVLHGLYKDY